MSFSAIGTFACRAIQQKLEDYYGANTAEAKTMGSNALVRYLLSPQNTAGFQQIADGITQTVPGKKRAVAFALDNPFCFDVCAIADVTCETERTALDNPTQEVVFDFDGPAFRVCNGDGDPLRLEFDHATLQKYCTETDTSYITRQIARFNRRFIEAFDKRMGELLSTMVGTNADGDTLTRIPFFIKHSSGLVTLNPEATWFLDQTYSDIGGVGQFALVGGKVLNKLIMYAKWAGLSDAGIDLSAIDDINPYAYYDRFLDATIGINNFFQLSPGAVQLVTFNQNIGENNRRVTDLYTHSTFIDPATGLEVDFEWYYEPKCRVWTYEPNLFAQLAVARPGGCGIPGANGVLMIEDCSIGASAPVCEDSASA
jgi:hypothetical protein